MADEKPDLPVKIELAATATAEIKAEIPSASMGRLVDSLTDAIRPFTEARGLKADQIRLQREDVLIAIARKAAKRLELEGKQATPIPNKLLVPLLEKASLEDIDDDEMIERWSTLLASAAAGISVPPRLVSILAELGASDALALEELFRRKVPRESIKLDNLTLISKVRRPFNAVVETFYEDVVGADLEKFPQESRGNIFFDYLDVLFSGHGLKMLNAMVAVDGHLRTMKGSASEPTQRSFEILESLGLVKAGRADGFLNMHVYDVRFLQITSLGVMLLTTCSAEAAKSLTMMTSKDNVIEG